MFRKVTPGLYAARCTPGRVYSVLRMAELYTKRMGLREPPLLFVTGGGLALGLYEFTLEVPWLRYVVMPSGRLLWVKGGWVVRLRSPRRTLLLLASSMEARSKVLARAVKSVRRRGGALTGIADYWVAPLTDLYVEGGRVIAGMVSRTERNPLPPGHKGKLSDG